jgi:hypothetical protein
MNMEIIVFKLDLPFRERHTTVMKPGCAFYYLLNFVLPTGNFRGLLSYLLLFGIMTVKSDSFVSVSIRSEATPSLLFICI